MKVSEMVRNGKAAARLQSKVAKAGYGISSMEDLKGWATMIASAVRLAKDREIPLSKISYCPENGWIADKVAIWP